MDAIAPNSDPKGPYWTTSPTVRRTVSNFWTPRGDILRTLELALPYEATFVSDCTPKTQVIVSVAAAGSPMAGLAASYAAASAP